jgi:cobalt-zinc-cadmium efflux system membrane fusion protein
MKNPLQFSRKATAAGVTVAAIIFATVLLRSGSGQPAQTPPPPTPGLASNSSSSEASVDLAPGQLSAIKIGPVGTNLFPVERTAVGSIDYDEDLWVQVFPPYQGKIINAFAILGDEVKKGQPLYTIDSPDLVQADSTLIGAAATLALTSKELARAKNLYGTNGLSERNRRRKERSKRPGTRCGYLERPRPKSIR